VSTKITISERDGWKIELVECEHPYPVLSHEGEPVNILFNRYIPTVVQEKFWRVLQEYNIFLEAEMEVQEDGCE